MPRKAVPQAAFEKPRIGLPDPLEAAQEAARLAQSGNTKLARCVDVMREALETIVSVSQPGMIDRQTGLPVSAQEMGQIAFSALNQYSAICGQNWKLPKNKLTGASRAGDRNLSTLEDA